MNDPSTPSQSHGRKRPRLIAWTLRIAAAAATLAIGSGQPVAYAKPFQAPAAAVSSPSACVPITEPPSGPPPPPKPTTITTLQQIYECIFAHQYGAQLLDDRTLLTGAFGRFTAELQRRGIDQPNATLPRLTGDRARDWAAFARTYQDVLAALPDNAQLRQALATETKQGMIDSLHANHIGFGGSGDQGDWLRLHFTFEGRPGYNIPPKDVRNSTGPMYLTVVPPGSPAANAGLKAGDIIEAVDGVPVFVKGKLTAGVLDLLHPHTEQDTVKITVHRPATDKTWTVELHPSGISNPPPAAPTVTLLDGGIVNVNYPAFSVNDTDEVLKKIADLRAHTSLHGIVLDLRGNGGGDPKAVAKLLGAFVHHKVWAWSCDVNNECTPNWADDSVALLHLPLVVLTDGRCASACDIFPAAVKDHRLGKLVGARTGGVIWGQPKPYLLDDNLLLALTPKRDFAPNGENIDGIGVAVDYQAPMTAKDLSTGRDPAMEKALSLLTE